ncbi:MAG: TonB family protein [Candidatus Saccharicenans sp.]
MSKKKILLIDFDSEFLKFLSQHLQEEGYEIITATDGVSGFEKFSDQAPDLVIMEAMLPKFHGFELCSRITSHPTKKAPVIIVTGIYKDAAYKTEALKNLGASAYLEKPLNLDELMKNIYALIGRPASAKTATLSDNLDDLLKSALSLEEKKIQARPQPKEEPLKKKPAATPDDLDKLLEANLKDLINEKNKPEGSTHPTATTKTTSATAQVKKTAASTVSEPIKTEAKAEPSAKPQVKEQVKPAEPSKTRSTEPEAASSAGKKQLAAETPASREAKPEAKAPAATPEPIKPRVAPVTSPFEKYVKEEETEKKKGTAKFIGLGLGLLVVALVGFLALKKKETPTFSGQSNNQTAAIQTVSSEPTSKDASDQDINQQIEKQMAEYKSQKSGSATDKKEADKNSASARTAKKVETPPAAAPLTPKESPSLALTNPSTPPENKTENAAPSATNTATEEKAQENITESAPESSQNNTENQPAVIPSTRVKTGDLVPLNMVDVEPKIVKTVEPIYPEVDRRMGIRGNVILNVLISETGDVLDVAVIRGIKGSVSLEKEAMNAVKKWKFLPAEKDGVKVRVWKPITIGFGLSK